jgi:hypothetical protein
MESTHHLKRARCLDRDLTRSICPEPESDAVDAIDQPWNVRRRSGLDGESIDPVAVSGDGLYLIEVHPHAQIPARNLGWIRSAPYDRAHYRTVTNPSGTRRDRDVIAHLEMRPRSKGFVDCDRARLPRYRYLARATYRGGALQKE